MGQRKNSSRGFTLIAALLILILLSGVAVGLLFMVGNESRMSGNDLESNLAYYGAQSGMEKAYLRPLVALHSVPVPPRRADPSLDHPASNFRHDQQHDLYREHHLYQECPGKSGKQP